MVNGNRDRGINHIKTRKKHSCYGMGLGIIFLDDAYPGFPGDVRNASAFPYPIQYEIAEGVDNDTLVWKEDKSPCLEPVKRAAKRLEQIGCRAIAAEYGCPEFDKLWDPEKRPECPEACYDKAEKDMIRVCSEFCGAHPDIGALMMECTGMQPFARAVQRVLDLPVFSWGTLLDYAYSVVAHRDYYGHV